MRFIEEREHKKVVYVIQCLNAAGKPRIIWESYNRDTMSYEYGRTYEDGATDGLAIRKVCERYAFESLQMISNAIDHAFNPENPDAKGWEDPSIKQLQGLHSFCIVKVEIRTQVDGGYPLEGRLQLNCDPERTVNQ